MARVNDINIDLVDFILRKIDLKEKFEQNFNAIYQQ